MAWMLFPVVILGHIGIWCAVYNQTHATAMPRKTRKAIEKLVVLFLIVVFGLMVYRRVRGFGFDAEAWAHVPALFAYEICCLAAGAFLLLRWIHRKFFFREIEEFSQHSRETIKTKAADGGSVLSSWDAKVLGLIPVNQATQISVESKTFSLAGFPSQLESLVVSHISDLHFTGKLSQDFYREVVKQSNRFEPDIVVISGDIVDLDSCIDWIEPVLGPLQARHKKYFVLGNHDRRVSEPERIRDAMNSIGFLAATGSWDVTEIQGAKIHVAGNELPWFYGAETLPPFERKSDSEFSMLISHSPDQFQFAVERNIDLVLAGHTHGGQVRFPIIGPIVAPSRHGVKYASGVFKSEETVMHVSRGIAGDDIIRINCPPELAILTLQSQPDA